MAYGRQISDQKVALRAARYGEVGAEEAELGHGEVESSGKEKEMGLWDWRKSLMEGGFFGG